MKEWNIAENYESFDEIMKTLQICSAQFPLFFPITMIRHIFLSLATYALMDTCNDHTISSPPFNLISLNILPLSMIHLSHPWYMRSTCWYTMSS